MANFAFRFTMSVLFLVAAYLVIKNGGKWASIGNTATGEFTSLVRVLQGRGGSGSGMQTASLGDYSNYGSYA